MTGTANPISISIAPATRAAGKRYYDLPGSLELMHRLWQASVVDGFEFQNLAEWDASGPPRDEAARRLAAWLDSQRYSIAELAARLHATGLPVLSIHANRDVGVCLCSGDGEDRRRGEALIHGSLALAEAVGAGVCVFHLWDTWKEAFDPADLQRILRQAAADHPGVKAAVENVPTQAAGATPFDLVQPFEWITLDLQWAALYHELDRFAPLVDRLANVHLRGRLEGRIWSLDGAPFDFYEALHTVRHAWDYRGPLTMEPNALPEGDLEGLVAAMTTLRAGDDS